MITSLIVLLALSLIANIGLVAKKIPIQRTLTQELVDKELDLYRTKRMDQVDDEARRKKLSYETSMAQLATEYADLKGNAAKYYHEAKQEWNVEIAKLRGEVNQLTELRNAEKALITAKDQEVTRLQTLLTEMIRNQPKQIVGVPVASNIR